MGLSIAKFMGCRIPPRTWFSRKTYFYPDLPKNFQITQYDSPLGENGVFEFSSGKVRIRRIHLEEDPGRIKRVGKSGEEISLIDYNRSGIPLVEIVTEPDLKSPSEAREFLNELLIELNHLLGTSVGDEHTVRVDANISVGEERVEIKNISGLKNLERALKFEAVRQTKLLKAGKKVLRETRRFDEEKKVTFSSRKKEMEEDYGYIGEPDLGVFSIGAVAEKLEIPETPLRRAKRMAAEYSIPYKTARQIVLTSWVLADLFEKLSELMEPSFVLPWIVGPLASHHQALGDALKQEHLDAVTGILLEVKEGKITDIEGRMRIESALAGVELEEEGSPPELKKTIAMLLDDQPSIVEDYRRNEKAANFLIGQVMKITRGKFSSEEVVSAVKAELNRRLGSL